MLFSRAHNFAHAISPRDIFHQKLHDTTAFSLALQQIAILYNVNKAVSANLQDPLRMLCLVQTVSTKRAKWQE